jgi:hypothetical protein
MPQEVVFLVPSWLSLQRIVSLIMMCATLSITMLEKTAAASMGMETLHRTFPIYPKRHNV